ncbi:MAG: transporter, partial [Leptospiraceae bacterium]|nr:transporter [Leptospiraceae bacterium]
SILAHHSGTTHSPVATTRFVDPFTGKREKPANYLVLTQDYYKGTSENSNIYTTTAFVEVPFYEGRFALNGSIPWTYFQQRNRSDAARIAKPYIGAKWLPLGDFEKNYFIMLEGSIGFPSSNDTDRFTGGNYYSGQGFFTFGYLLGKWGIVVKAGGLQPLSKPQPYNLQDNDGIPYYLRLASENSFEPRYTLKKVTVYQAYLSYYMISQISLFAGYLYRTPYQGIDFDNETKRTIPRIFTEGSLGFTYNFSERYNLTVTYRYPFYQKKDHKLYEEAWTLAFSMEWGK